MKPDWKDAPKWANFVAMDRNGEWYWYEREPIIMSRSWAELSAKGRIWFAGTSKNWRESLEPRP